MRTFPVLLALAVPACATMPGAAAHDAFFRNLSTLCGQAYEGRIVSPGVPADAAFAGSRLVMHVRDCSPSEIRIPFHVGEDRSRTWVIARLAERGQRERLTLKHDHRHADGEEDRLSRYGGMTVTPGTANRQDFPVDSFSRALFLRENRPESVTNVWAVEVHPSRMFAYELRRRGRFFRVEFDLARPLEAPPPR